MRVTLKDFRCFHDSGSIELRPVNLLVGENSSGKTSFLAAVRMLFDLFGQQNKASFNKDPFFLGAYEQIAHFRGGRFGRAKSFSFSVSDSIDKPYVQRILDRPSGRRSSSIPDIFEMCVSFKNHRSQPIIESLRFSAGDYSLDAVFDDNLQISVETPSGKISNAISRLTLRRGEDPISLSISSIELLLREIRFTNLEREHSAGPTSSRDELQVLSEVYRYAIRRFRRDIYASAPVRSEPRRTYNPGDASPLPSGDHIPFILAQLKSFDKDKWLEIVRTLSVFGDTSGLFQDISVKRLSNTEGGPFQIIVSLGGHRMNIIDVGYGTSQALPIIADLARAPNRTQFLYQQPEVHLHPRAQAELGTFFSQMVDAKKHTLLIETHSDYLIDRIRMEARGGRYIRPQDVALIFFERRGLDVVVHQLRFDKLGNVVGAPPGYRKFFMQEEFRSLGMGGT